jgi:endonuclease/exonuclease/phosphatase (EEP) superfamily protein YafD
VDSIQYIYGPAHDDRMLEFLDEIQSKVQTVEHPIILGGDFNMVRKAEEKSNGNVNV